MTRAFGFLLLMLCGLAVAFFPGHPLSAKDELVFDDAAGQSRQFMEWYRSIQLTPEQEAVKREALAALPAPCCSNNNAYTCCCQCNVSRTVWGLAQYMIARQGASAAQVRDKVKAWIAFVNPKGYSGRSCYNGGCARKFSEDGCGGMNAGALVL